jgi:MFS family permease
VSRNAWVVSITLFLVAYGTNVSTPFLVVYKERLDLGQSATMAIFTVYVLGIMGTLVVAGPLSDRFGRRALVIPFTLVSALASVIMIFGRDEFLLLLVGRFLLGVVSGAVFGVGAAWLQELMGEKNLSKAAIVATAATFAGFGFGPPISAFIYSVGDNGLIVPFALHAGLTALFVPVLLTVPETVSPNSNSIQPRLGVPVEARGLFLKVIVPAAAMVFVFPSSAFALFPVLVSDAIGGAEVWVAGIVGALTAWAGMLARPLVSRLGARKALPIGMAMGACGYLLGTVAFGTDAWQLLLPAAVLLGGAAGTLTAGALGMLSEIAEPETRGALNSTFYLLAYVGMAMPIFITSLAATGLGLTVVLVGVTTAAFGATAWVASTSRLQF